MKNYCIMLSRAAAVGGVLVLGGCDNPVKPPRDSQKDQSSDFPQQRPDAPAGKIARIHVAGTDGTAELQRIVANELTQGEIIALGLGVVLTGGDTYAARIRITNTGTVPVHFFPENLAVHFGREAVGVTTINHPRFLQQGILQPNRFFEGLVMYRARIDIGAAMRLAGGGLSYNDDTIVVTYNR